MKSSRSFPLTGSILRKASCGFLLAGFAMTAQAEQVYQAWQQIYNQAVPAGHSGNATTTDSRGNVIVAGFAADLNGIKQFYTAKYAAGDGSLIWERIYTSGNGDCLANAVAVDSGDNVIVTGRTASSGNIADYYTVKYDADQGTTLWEKTFAGAQGGADIGLKIVVDHADDVVVAGTSYGNGTQEDWLLLKYTSALGVQEWGNGNGVRINGGGNQKDVPTGLAVDSANNVLVTGKLIQSGGKAVIYTQKLTPAGASVWGITANTGAAGDCEATGLVVDSANRVAVTGIVRKADNTRAGFTVEYSAAGAPVWSANLDCGPDNFTGGPASIALAPDGSILVAATTQENNAFETKHITTVKYAGGSAVFPGFALWTAASPSPDGTDFATKVLSDGAGNAVVTGASNDTVNHAADIYTAKYASTDGHLLSDFRYDGVGSNDAPHDLALDDFGNAIVTGVTSLYYNNSNIKWDRIFTSKYNRLRMSVGEDAPGAGVAGSGIPAGAKVIAVSTPALADTGAIAVRLTVAKGAVKISALLKQTAGGANTLLAVQGQPAAGAGGGNYATFLDPVIAPDGRVAFTGHLTGVPAAQATAVWITDNTNTVLRKLQSGQQVPDLASGLLLRSVQSLSWRNFSLVAQLQLSGTGVTAKNATVLYGLHTVFGGAAILRTGDPFTVSGQAASTILSLNTFTPAAGSPGQGRSVSSSKLVTRITLANKTVALVSTSVFGGAPTVLEYTGGPAPLGDAKWKTLGLPVIGSANQYLATAGALQPSAAGAMTKVTALNDQAVVFSSNGASFSVAAREGDLDAAGHQYASFLDPLVNNQGALAFVGTLRGAGVTARNATALWSGAGQIPSTLHIVARVGFAAPEASGEVLAVNPPLFSQFISTALPGGQNAGPLLLAKVAGPGVTVKNNLGVWAVDSTGTLRNLLRTGQKLGTRTVLAINLLQSTAGGLGVSRSFDEAGSAEALVTFTDHTSGVLHLAIP